MMPKAALHTTAKPEWEIRLATKSGRRAKVKANASRKVSVPRRKSSKAAVKPVHDMTFLEALALPPDEVPQTRIIVPKPTITKGR
jgi:hypothetical protein